MLSLSRLMRGDGITDEEKKVRKAKGEGEGSRAATCMQSSPHEPLTE